MFIFWSDDMNVSIIFTIEILCGLKFVFRGLASKFWFIARKVFIIDVDCRQTEVCRNITFYWTISTRIWSDLICFQVQFKFGDRVQNASKNEKEREQEWWYGIAIFYYQIIISVVHGCEIVFSSFSPPQIYINFLNVFNYCFFFNRINLIYWWRKMD